ncbi:hypothetical protein U729_3143 (plasmid) [Clostridium baratii str. Sullivan]|uniref:Uncharacterized protein n=1 Tax=Clostridium baratii str. Sullivan TaxID=1415775 RepID=A0A0A7G300_9CLOT|nr:hypothetical protein [Clostridium baratii]AIY85390.1 hypothetical protein U729_3143 [Clostridium baratii str. Sullivan]
MFDTVNINKAYTITDNVTGNKVEIVNFNASVRVDSGITTDVNIGYPDLYQKNLDEITEEFKKFQANVFSLAVAMGTVGTAINGPATLPETSEVHTSYSSRESQYDALTPVIETLQIEAKKAMDQIVDGLHDIKVNVTPVMEQQYNINPMRRY